MLKKTNRWKISFNEGTGHGQREMARILMLLKVFTIGVLVVVEPAC